LPDLELFHGCRSRELREFGQLCTTVSVRSGRVLCRQGEIGRECFVIVAGRADVFIDNARVATVAKGDLVGELALLADRASRTATVVATTDMRLLVLTRREFAALAESAPGVLQRVLREATRRLVENSARR
jgi:NTE family protein